MDNLGDLSLTVDADESRFVTVTLSGIDADAVSARLTLTGSSYQAAESSVLLLEEEYAGLQAQVQAQEHIVSLERSGLDTLEINLESAGQILADSSDFEEVARELYVTARQASTDEFFSVYPDPYTLAPGELVLEPLSLSVPPLSLASGDTWTAADIALLQQGLETFVTSYQFGGSTVGSLYSELVEAETQLNAANATLDEATLIRDAQLAIIERAEGQLLIKTQEDSDLWGKLSDAILIRDSARIINTTEDPGAVYVFTLDPSESDGLGHGELQVEVLVTDGAGNTAVLRPALIWTPRRMPRMVSISRSLWTQ